jgi:aminopeptidase YwaD
VAAADYIAEQLSAAGYQVERQHFTFPQFEERSASLSVTWDRGASETSVETHALLYSGAGGVNGRLAFAGFGRSDDFRGLDLRGAVVLMERGADVTFRDKAERAFAAGAAAAVIYNNTPRPFLGSLQVGMPLPVLAISGAGGQRLRTLMDAGPVMAHVAVDATVDERPAQNVVGTRPAPSAGAATVVIGAHYDSVQISPGANDNASGAAVVLEMARVLAHDPPQANIVFVSFAAEELGLLGSAHFVGALHPDARASVAAMLNFDMVGVGEDVLIGGSPALVRTIEGVGAEQGLKLGHMGSSLTGRSDHASFVAAGIPSAFFHVSDDPNYHTPADVVDGISTVRLAEVGTLGTEVVRRLARG